MLVLESARENFGKMVVMAGELSDSDIYKFFGLLGEFCRYSQMVNGVYSDEVDYFLNTSEADIGETGDEVEHLIIAGFYTRVTGNIGFGSSITLAKQPAMTDGERVMRSILTNAEAI